MYIHNYNLVTSQVLGEIRNISIFTWCYESKHAHVEKIIIILRQSTKTFQNCAANCNNLKKCFGIVKFSIGELNRAQGSTWFLVKGLFLYAVLCFLFFVFSCSVNAIKFYANVTHRDIAYKCVKMKYKCTCLIFIYDKWMLKYVSITSIVIIISIE